MKTSRKIVPDSGDRRVYPNRELSTDPKNVRQREWQRDQRAARKLAGVCVTGCGRPVVGRAYCFACVDKQVEYNERYYLKKAGLAVKELR